MSPRSISELALHHPPVLHSGDTVEQAVRAVLESGMPALAVVDINTIFTDGELSATFAFPSGLLDRVHVADRIAYLSAIADLREGADLRRCDVRLRLPSVETIAIEPAAPVRRAPRRCRASARLHRSPHRADGGFHQLRS